MLLIGVLVLVAGGAALLHADARDRAARVVTRTPIGAPTRTRPAGVDARLLVLGSSPLSYDLRTGAVSVLAGGPGTDPGSVQEAISLAGGDILAFARPGGGLLAYGVRAGHPAVALGAVSDVVPAGAGTVAWLIGLPGMAGVRTVREVRPDGRQTGSSYPWPAGTRLAGGGAVLVLTRGIGVTEEVLTWEPGTGSPKVLVRGADVLAAAGATAVLQLPGGEIRLLDWYGDRPRQVPVELPGPVSGPVAISRDGTRFALAISQPDPRGVRSNYVVMGRTGTRFRGVTVVAGATLPVGPGQLAPQWTHSDVLVLADPVSRRVLVLDPGATAFRPLQLALPEFAAVRVF